jgi:hypothetical protein
MKPVVSAFNAWSWSDLPVATWSPNEVLTRSLQRCRFRLRNRHPLHSG